MAASEGAGGGQAAADYAQAVKYLGDLTEVFAHQHDTEVVEEIRALQRQLGTAFQVQQTSARDIIAALQQDVSEVEATALRPEAAAAFEARLADIEGSRQEVLASLSALAADKAATLEQVQALRAKTAAVNEAVAQLDADQAVQLPRVKHSLSLYANISGIKWDFDSPDIAGHIMPEGRPIKAFSIKAGSLDEFQLANALWAAVGEASGISG